MMSEYGFNPGPNTPALGRYRVVPGGWPGFPKIDGGNIVGEMVIPGGTLVDLVWTDGPTNADVVVPVTATKWYGEERLTVAQDDLRKYTEPA